MSDPYTTLDVPQEADPATIKQRYRTLAKEHHPDTGGDHTTFANLAKAYAILSDPVRRQQYDTFGEDADIPSEAEKMLQTMFSGALEARDPVGAVKQHLTNQHATITRELTATARKRKALHQQRQRVGPASPLLLRAYDAAIDSATKKHQGLSLQLSLIEKAQDIIQSYTFEVEPLTGSQATHLGATVRFDWRNITNTTV